MLPAEDGPPAAARTRRTERRLAGPARGHAGGLGARARARALSLRDQREQLVDLLRHRRAEDDGVARRDEHRVLEIKEHNLHVRIEDSRPRFSGVGCGGPRLILALGAWGSLVSPAGSIQEGPNEFGQKLLGGRATTNIRTRRSHVLPEQG